MKKNLKTLATRFLALSCAIVFCSTSVIVQADDVDRLEQQTTNLQNQLNELNHELNSLSSEITTIALQINEASTAVEKARLDLAAAKLNEEMQYTAMKKRIKFMYETGNPSFLDMICRSKDMADFLNRTEFVKHITKYDRNMLAELKVIRADIEEKETFLKEEQAHLLSMQDTLKTKSSELSAKISSTSSELQASAEALANAKAAQEAASNSSGHNGNSTESSENTRPAPPSNETATDDLVLFAGILQCEAGTSNYDALLAVATVIMNRVESPNYPNSLYGVIYQRGQFSPTWNGSLSRVLAKGPASLCYQAARDALNGSRLASVQNCFSFNATWTGKQGIIVGGNVFW